MSSSPTTTFITRQEVRRRTGMTDRMIDRRVREGEFPQPVALGRRQTAWVEAEVEAYNRQRIADRDAGVLPPGREALLETRRLGGLKSAELRKQRRADAAPQSELTHA